jgi:glycosyltransferase involved in cell wall biosynthesis
MKLAGIAQKKILLIENGVNLERFTTSTSPEAIKESLGIKKEALVVGTIGALTREKGHQYLLRAALKVIRIYPKAIFLLVGDGTERPNLEKTASSLGIKNSVIFAGMRKDVPEILSILNVFVLPSLNEGLPMALLEAHAARIPVVATRVGAIPDVLEDGVTGILIPPKDPQAIAEAIIMILSDKQLASGIAQKGFERVRDNFSSEKMANKYLSIYRELLS